MQEIPPLPNEFKHNRAKQAWLVIGVGIVMFIAGAFCGYWLGFYNSLAKAMRNATSSVQGSSDMKVGVVARQYDWHFHYPGADGEFGVTRYELSNKANPFGLDTNSEFASDDFVTNELVLPQDSAVMLYIKSMDVIHGFSGVPGFGITRCRSRSGPPLFWNYWIKA